MQQFENGPHFKKRKKTKRQSFRIDRFGGFFGLIFNKSSSKVICLCVSHRDAIKDKSDLNLYLSF